MVNAAILVFDAATGTLAASSAAGRRDYADTGDQSARGEDPWEHDMPDAEGTPDDALIAESTVGETPSPHFDTLFAPEHDVADAVGDGLWALLTTQVAAGPVSLRATGLVGTAAGTTLELHAVALAQPLAAIAVHVRPTQSAPMPDRVDAQPDTSSAQAAATVAQTEEHLIVFRFNTDGIILSASDRATMALDYLGEDLSGRHHDTLVPPEVSTDPEYVDFWQSLAQGRTVEGLYVHQSMTGDLVYLSCSYIPVWGSDGRVHEIVQYAVDVSALVRSERSARQRADATAMGFATAELDAEGTFLHVNPRLADIFGYAPDELQGQSSSRVLDPETARSPMTARRWAQVMAGEITEGEIRRMHRDGSLVLLRAWYFPLRDESGQITRVLAHYLDITEATTNMLRLQAWYDAAHSSMFAIEYDAEGHVTHANGVAAKALGLQANELVGRTDASLCHPVDLGSQAHTDLWASLRRGEFSKGEFCRIASNGRKVWINGSFEPMRSQDNRVTGVLLLARDVTEARLTAQQTTSRLEALQSGLAVAEFQPDGTLATANAAFLAAVGQRLEHVYGLPREKIVRIDQGGEMVEAARWQRILRGEPHSTELALLASQGRPLAARGGLVPMLDAEGQVWRVLLHAVPVDDLRDRLTAVEARWSAVQRIVPVVEYDPSGNVVTASEAFLGLVGYALRDIRGQHASLFVTAEEARSQKFREFWLALEKGERQEGRVHRLGRFQRDIHADTVVVPLRDSSSEVMEVVEVLRDVSELVTLRGRIAEAAATAERQTVTIRQHTTREREVSSRVAEISAQALVGTGRGQQAMAQVGTSIGEAARSTREIHEIVNTISDIAVQTNLLAFNAAIEAARAGENGLGFSIVADEVRKLAENSSTAAQAIRRLIDTASSSIRVGQDGVQGLGTVIADVESAVGNLAPLAVTITGACDGIEAASVALDGLMSAVRSDDAAAA
jgi:methyl-accepting chemotaxis protein